MMELPALDSGADFAPCPEGTHLAACVGVIDLGTQHDQYEGETKIQHKLWITWETTEEMNEEGKPFRIGKQYTLSMHEKSALRRDLEAWRGERFQPEDVGPGGRFDIKNLLGATAFLSIGRTKSGKAKVVSVIKPPKGTPRKVEETESTLDFLSLTAVEFDRDVVDRLPDFLREMVTASPQYKDLVRPPEPQSSADIPGTPQLQRDPLDADSTPF